MGQMIGIFRWKSDEPVAGDVTCRDVVAGAPMERCHQFGVPFNTVRIISSSADVSPHFLHCSWFGDKGNGFASLRVRELDIESSAESQEADGLAANFALLRIEEELEPSEPEHNCQSLTKTLFLINRHSYTVVNIDLHKAMGRCGGVITGVATQELLQVLLVLWIDGFVDPRLMQHRTPIDQGRNEATPASRDLFRPL